LRYDGDDYRGFMMVEDILSLPPHPLPAGGAKVANNPAWQTLFPDAPRPQHRLNLVLVWSTLNAHSPRALVDLQAAQRNFERTGAPVGVMTAVDLVSVPADVARVRAQNGIAVPELPLAPDQFIQTEAVNQIPTTLLFYDGIQVDRRLGAQSLEQLREWVDDVLRKAAR
jgi:hypothetical protein